MKPRILVISSVNMDFMMKTSVLPTPGETILDHGGSCRFTMGGKGVNAAVAFTRLEGDCVLCARVGKDENGNTLRRGLRDAGIDTRFLMTDSYADTGMAAVISEVENASRILVYPGANDSLNPADIEAAFTCHPDAVFLQLEIPEDAIIAATRCAEDMGVPVFLDAAPARRDIAWDKVSPLEVFSPNEKETFAYTGIDPIDADHCLRAAVKLGNLVKARYYVLKLGARGAYVYDGKYANVLSAPDVRVVDKNAAGDAFSAALTLHYLRTRNIVKAVNFANLVGAATVTRPGAVGSIPNFDELESFAAEHAHGIEF